MYCICTCTVGYLCTYYIGIQAPQASVSTRSKNHRKVGEAAEIGAGETQTTETSGYNYNLHKYTCTYLCMYAVYIHGEQSLTSSCNLTTLEIRSLPHTHPVFLEVVSVSRGKLPPAPK